MTTTDVGLLRYLSSKGQPFLPIGFTANESDAEGQFILDTKEDVFSNGIGVIVAKYPPLGAFFSNIHQHDSQIHIAMFEILNQGMTLLKEDLSEVSDGKLENLSKEKIELYGKPLAVIFFLLYKSYDTFGCLVTAEPEETSRPITARSKKSNAKSTSSGYAYWYEWELKLFSILSQIISHPLNLVVWKNADTNFLCFIISCCSSLIRHTPHSVLNDDKYLGNLVNILGHLWKTHKMQAEVTKIFVAAIERSEDSSVLVTRIAKLLAMEFGLTHVCLNILERTYGGVSAAKFANSEKALAFFLVEMTTHCPERMCAGLPILRNILYCDSPILRTAVLQCAGEILAWSKSEDVVILRKRLLGVLLGHINDTAIPVRAKAISILGKLIEEKKLYLIEEIQALNVVARKINDKAASVRKSTMTFFKALATGNPILTKFSLEEIQEKLRKHLSNYFESMVAGIEDDEVVLKQVALVFEEEVNSNEYGFENLHLPESMNTPEKSLEYIQEKVKAKLYWDACEALKIASDKWRDEGSFERFGGRGLTATHYFVFLKRFLGIESESNELVIDMGTVGRSEKSLHDKGRVVYYKEIKQLKLAFESTFPALCLLLEIGALNDKKETINLIATYCEDGFVTTPELTNSIMTALGKVGEKMASDLLDSFFKIFIPGMGKTSSSSDMATKLARLVSSMNSENKDKMITLFQEMFKNTRSMKDCIKDLWTIYNNADTEKAKAAVYLIGIKGSLDERYIVEWLQPMMSVGLGPKGIEDFTLATATCNAILTMYEHCVTKDPDGILEHHLLFEKLEEFIQYGLQNVDTNIADQDYADFVDVAIRIVYYVCDEPLTIVSEIIHYLSQYVFTPEFKINPLIAEGRIHRYVALAEVIIECHVYFYEVIVIEEIKQRKALIESKRSEQKMGPPKKDPPGKKSSSRKGIPSKGRPNRNFSTNGNNTTMGSASDESTLQNGSKVSDDSTVSRRSIMNRMSRKNLTLADGIDKTAEMEEMVGVGDREYERIRDYLDSMLNEGLMSQVRLHVMHMCKQMDILSYPTQVSCIGLLTKVMCINSHGMLGTMQFFLELWEKTTCQYLKVELIKAAVYINMRFPNSMELCNKSITKGLRDENIKIRAATLDFIIYLCLSEVIKVREYLIASSICLNDAHPPLRDSAQDFFTKMAEKNNIVYNCFPEIITFLSCEKNISAIEYQQIMKFLLVKLKKPAQLAGLIEKLVSRFKYLEIGRPRQDVAYCLSLLPYNDKTFRIIEDGFSLYCDKLEDALVYDAFVQILTNAKKNCTKDYKITIEKFETNLTTWKENCDNREGQNKSVAESCCP